MDGGFQQRWREELLRRTWDALQAVEQETGRPVFIVMRARVDNPGMSASDLAASLSGPLGKTISTANLRVMLHRSRDEFAKLLLDEISNTLSQPTRTTLEEELVELGLLEYCRPALEKLDGQADS